MNLILIIPTLIYIVSTLYVFVFKRKSNYFFLLVLSILLAYFGATYIEKINLDFSLYKVYFDALSFTSFRDLLSFPDTLFWSIAKIFNIFFENTPFYNYFFIIILSVFLKCVFARENVSIFLIPLFLYLITSRYLILHDYTQLRASLAIGISSIIFLRFLKNEKLNKVDVFLIILSVFMHISVSVFIPLYFFINKIIEKRNFIILLFILFFCIIVGQFFSNFFQNLLTYLDGFKRVQVYIDSSAQGADQIQSYSIFQFYFLFKSLLLIFLIRSYKYLSRVDKSLVCVYIIAMCFQSAFVFNSAIGLRLASLFGYIDILVVLLPLRYKYFKDFQLIYYVGLLGVGYIFLYSSLLGIWDRL